MLQSKIMNQCIYQCTSVYNHNPHIHTYIVIDIYIHDINIYLLLLSLTIYLCIQDLSFHLVYYKIIVFFTI